MFQRISSFLRKRINVPEHKKSRHTHTQNELQVTTVGFNQNFKYRLLDSVQTPMDSESINTRVDHVAVVGQDFELDQVVGNLRRFGQVEGLNGRTVFVVSEIALKKRYDRKAKRSLPIEKCKFY